MNEAEFMNRIDALIDGLHGRLQAKEISFMSGPQRGGEYEEVLDMLLALISNRKIPLFRRELDEIRAVAGFLHLPVTMCDFINDWENIVASANVIDEAPDREEPRPAVPSGPPVVVYDNPDFGRTLRTQVGLHVDLPQRLYEPFVDHFTAAVGVGVEINLARTNPDQYLRKGQVRTPTKEQSTLVPRLIMLLSQYSIWGGGILLRGFEQWWTKARSDAETLLRQFPTILTTEQLGDDNFHIALADMTSSTVDEVLAVLAAAEIDQVVTEYAGPQPPVPVFKYPPA